MRSLILIKRAQRQIRRISLYHTKVKPIMFQLFTKVLQLSTCTPKAGHIAIKSEEKCADG